MITTKILFEHSYSVCWVSQLALRGHSVLMVTFYYKHFNTNKLFNIKQVFYAFLYNINNNSPKVSNTKRRKTESNMILTRLNNFAIKQKMAYGGFILIYTLSAKQNQNRWI